MAIEFIIIFSVMAVSILLLSGGIIWLILEQNKLKVSQDNLLTQVDSMSNDIAVVCSTAVNVDMRLSQQSTQVDNVVKDVNQHKKIETEEKQPYSLAIQKVQSGASSQELIKECGLSREEAALLIKLHG
mgnify:CR=1 FL=1